MTTPTKAQIFQSAFAVYEHALYPLDPTPHSIVQLAVATDRLVQFGIDKSQSVTFIFSDGTRAVVAPRQVTMH